MSGTVKILWDSNQGVLALKISFSVFLICIMLSFPKWKTVIETSHLKLLNKNLPNKGIL